MILHNSNLFCDVYINKWTKSKTNSPPFIDSNLFWYLFLSESKSYFITSSASSIIIISILSLFECNTRSSSLSMKEIKLIATLS